MQAYGVFIEPDARSKLVNECRVVTISPLLKELIRSAMQIQTTIHPQSREARLLELILDELELLLFYHLTYLSHKILNCKSFVLKSNLISAIHGHSNMPPQFLHVSPKTLTRHFQKETNMHFSHWVRQARLMQAMTDLAMNKSIFNVALDLGYDSASAFSAMFKRETSLTPSEYIQQFQFKDH